MRLLRLALAIAIIYQGIELEQWLFVVIGGLFALMPLMNIGCCGNNGCATPLPKTKQKNNVYRIIMKLFFQKNLLIITGISLGLIAGYLYWHFMDVQKVVPSHQILETALYMVE